MHGQNITYDYIIRDSQGERRLSVDDFPIVIGSGASADIRIADPGGEREMAYIGLSQAHPFVQAASAETPVLLNAQKLKGSAWLYHDDAVQIGNYLLRVLMAGQAIVFQIFKPDADRLTAPRVAAPTTVAVPTTVFPSAETPRAIL